MPAWSAFWLDIKLNCYSSPIRVAPSPATSDASYRSGIAAVSYASPAVLSHASFARLVTPVEQDVPCRSTKLYASPLEKYFGAVYLAKHLLRVVNKDETVGELSGRIREPWAGQDK